MTGSSPPSSRMEDVLLARLNLARQQGLYRETRTIDSPQSTHIRLEGHSYLNFSSNDYLGLANHPAVREAAIAAIERYGAGAGASRLVCGSLRPHQELDEALAMFKRSEAAISFSSGYAAALGTICALAGKNDVIILDKLVHACIVDAAKLSGATLRVFRHNDLDGLERLLAWSDRRRATRPDMHILVATESVFSMDGDLAPLAGIVDLKTRFGAWLLVDEAHAIGVLGPGRRGLAEELHLAGQTEIQMGTLGKALGSAGGYIAGSRTLINYLVNKARSFVFSTAPSPAAAAAATAAVQIVNSPEGERRCNALWQAIRALTFPRIQPSQSAIVPVVIGEETRALAAAASLRDAGFYVPAIRYPTVARGAARLRVTLTADHSPTEVAKLQTALKTVALEANAG